MHTNNYVSLQNAIHVSAIPNPTREQLSIIEVGDVL